MRHKQRIDGLFLDEFFEHMLRHFEISQLRQDFQFEFIRGAIAPLLPRKLEPISPGNFPHHIMVAFSAPGPLQINGANNFPVSASMLNC
jgi:hypothetical protein